MLDTSHMIDSLTKVAIATNAFLLVIALWSLVQSVTRRHYRWAFRFGVIAVLQLALVLVGWRFYL